MKLRTRLALALAGAVAIGAIVFTIAARVTVEQMLYHDIDRDLQVETDRTIRSIGGSSVRSRDERDRRRDGDAGRADPRFGDRRPGEFFGRDALYAQVSGRDGTIYLRTSAVESIGGLPDPRIEPRVDDLEIRTTRIDGERFRLAEANGPGDTVVQLARPLSELAAFIDTLQWVLVAASLIALAAAALLGRWVARATLRPVEAMTRTTRAIARAPHDLSNARVEPAFPDAELAEFADAMNEMLGAIDDADRQQRQFVADASHELRTPLTSLGGNATYLQRTKLADEDARDAVAAVERDVVRLTRIADGLTTLARLDSMPTAQLEPVDVAEVAREAIRRCEQSYAHHQFQLVGSAPVLLLDAELVRRIVGNLLDNAGRYTPDGTIVHIELAPGDRDESLEIVVTDDGPGIPEEESEAVLDRFHRGSTSAGTSGTGLGLAIVAEAAQALGGSLELEQADPHGLRCRVQLRSGGHVAG